MGAGLTAFFMAFPEVDLCGAAILQVIPSLETGGAERTTAEIGAAIVAAGGRSFVVTEGGALTERLRQEGSEVLIHPVGSKNPRVIFRNKGVLLSVIEDEGIDLVHARSRAPAWSALMAARAAGAGFVTTWHGAYGGKTRLKRLYNSVMARGDAVIANSAFTEASIRQSYRGWGFMEGRRLVTIPRGADLSAFDRALVTADRAEAAEKALGGKDALRVLMPGRLTAWKGQAVLIEAARLLQSRQDLPALRVALIGSAQGRTDYEEELRRMIEASGLTEIVHLHGHWDDMPAAYGWADIAVSASTRPEAFGRVAVEAQAMGLPVVATDHGGSRETVAPGETGLLVPPGDAPALATAIGRLAGDGATRRDMGEAGAARAKALFSTQAMTSATLRVYEELLTIRAAQKGEA